MNIYGNSKIKSGLIGAVIVLALGGAGAFAINKSADVPNANVAQAKDGSKDDTRIDATRSGELLSIDEVKDLSTVKSAGSAVSEVELEEEHGAWLYKVQLANGKELFFDARSGEATDKNDRMMNDNHQAMPIVNDTTLQSITSRRAAQIAKDHNGGGIIRKIERETEHGAAIYSVRFNDGARVDVQASDGAIVRVESGDNDKESDRNDKRGDDRGWSKDDDSRRDD